VMCVPVYVVYVLCVYIGICVLCVPVEGKV